MEENLVVDNNKTKKLSKKQIWGFVAFGVIMLCIFVAFTTIFILNFNKTIPERVKFVDEQGQIYCLAQANDNFEGYRFSFDDGKNKLTFESKSSVLHINQLQGLTFGTNYNVSVCYLGEIEGGNSEESGITTWQYYTYLDAPVAEIDADTITWQSVENADFYEVVWISDKINKITVTTNYVNFNQLTPGVIDVQVIARSNREYFRPTIKPLTKNFTITQELSQFSSVTLSQTSNTLIIVGRDKVDTIEININGKSYLSEKFSVSVAGGVYTYRVDISSIMVANAQIGAKPVSNNKYITYSGDFVFAN